MKKNAPLVSLILSVYNEEKFIAKCLRYIRKQDFPQDQIEILIVDDYSTDNTLDIAKKYNVKIVKSGFKNIERSKSIGVKHAKGEFVFLIDADVFLISNKFIKRAVELLSTHKDAVAFQCVRWNYRKNDFIINRYCNLFGINDPLVFFLGKRGVLMATEEDWMYKNTVLQKGKDFFLTEFTSKNLPTVGSQGYIVRRKNIMKTSWKPYLFHLDTALEMVKKGENKFILSKIPIEHSYVHSFHQYFSKLARNITLFHKLRKYRTYDYEISPVKLIIPLILMVTIVVPLIQSIKGYSKKPDVAWFLHPVFCLIVPLIYSYISLKFKLSKIR